MTKIIPTVQEINEYINSRFDYEENHIDTPEEYRIALRETAQGGDKEKSLENFKSFCKEYGVDNKGFKFDNDLFDKLIDFIKFEGDVESDTCHYGIIQGKDKFYLASIPIIEHEIQAPDEWDLSDIDKDSDSIDAYYANGYFYIDSSIAVSLTLDKNQAQDFFDELWERYSDE